MKQTNWQKVKSSFSNNPGSQLLTSPNQILLSLSASILIAASTFGEYFSPIFLLHVSQVIIVVSAILEFPFAFKALAFLVVIQSHLVN